MKTVISVSFETTPTPADVAAALREQADAFDSGAATVGEPAPEAPAKKRGRPAKSEAPADDQGAFDLGDMGESSAPVLTLDDVTLKLNAFYKKNGRDKAVAVLKKFGVKSCKELDASKYSDFVAALS